MEAFDGDSVYAIYDVFTIDEKSEKYRLHVEGYHGSAGDMLAENDGMMFSTYDADHDAHEDMNCVSSLLHSAWWIHACDEDNLNGVYIEGLVAKNSAHWKSFKGLECLKRIEMILFKPLETGDTPVSG